jgi:precorrin isomerase
MGDIASSNVCNGVEHLLNRISTACAEVAASSTLSLQQGLHRADMGRSKVHDMDIIADGRTVRGGIVGPEYGELAKLPRESRHGPRYQIRLVLPLFTDARF